jgi:hypothetical protein
MFKVKSYQGINWYLHLFAFGFGAILFGLSVSKVIVSIGQFVMAFAWFASGNYSFKVKAGFNSPVVVSFTIILLIHLAGLFYTDNYTYAWNDIKIKLPLFVIPFMIAGMPAIRYNWQKNIASLFWLGLLISSIGTWILYFGFGDKPITDSRYLSPFVSHIRISIMLVFGIISLLYYFYKERNFLLVLMALFFLITLFVIKSGTGLALLILAVFILSFFASLKYRVFILALMAIFLVFSSFYLYQFYNSHFKLSSDFKLKNKTLNNHLYAHQNTNELENGFYVWKNICETEMAKSWNRVSDIPYNGNDLNNQPIRNTLIRYLASKHLDKDSVGIAALSSIDLYNIRYGFTNYLFTDQKSISYKVYQILYEIHMFNTKQYANNHSLTMRLLFMQTGLRIWENNFWFGVGTGDVQDSFNWQYEFDQVELDEENRLRAHNQFLTFGITFGIIGFLAILWMLLRLFKKANRLTFISLLLLLASFLNEDTLETQIGLTMFVGIICFSTLVFNPEQPN